METLRESARLGQRNGHIEEEYHGEKDTLIAQAGTAPSPYQGAHDDGGLTAAIEDGGPMQPIPSALSAADTDDYPQFKY
jgi:hypothetical protein